MSLHPHATLPKGLEIAGHTVVKPVGRGGFGIVYEVTHPFLGRRAMKEFFYTGLASRVGTRIVVNNESDKEFYAKLVERFIATAQTLHSFDHPNILKVHHLEANGNAAYVFTDFVDGETLAGWLAKNWTRLDEARVHAIFDPIVAALEYCHRKGFIHRDIAPDNIMVRDKDGAPVLIDFGAVKQTVREDDTVHQKRGSTLLVAKDRYAPPEQLTFPAPVPLKAYTDVFALGATMYQTLAGEPPPDSKQRSAEMSQHRPDPYVSISRATKVACAPEMYAAIDRALSLAAGQRPQSMAEMRKAMRSTETIALPQQASNRQAVAPAITGFIAPQIPGGTPVQAQPKRRRALAIGAAAATIAAAVTLGVVIPNWPDRDAQAHQVAVTANTENAYRDYLKTWPNGRYVAEVERRLGDFDRAYWDKASKEDTTAAYNDYLRRYPSGLFKAKASERKAQLVALDADRQREREAWRQATLENSIESYNRYLRDWPRGANASEASSKKDALEAATRTDHAACTSSSQDHQRIIDACTKALKTNANDWLVHYNLGISLNAIRRHQEALPVLTRALALNTGNAEIWNSRGFAYLELARWDDALNDFDEAVRLNPRFALAVNNRGVVFDRRGDRQRAIGEYKQAITIEPQLFLAQKNLGLTLSDLGRHRETVEPFSRALAINKGDFIVWYRRGLAYLKLQQWSEALADFDETLRIKPGYQPAISDRALALFHRGAARLESRDYHNAIADLQSVVAINPNHADGHKKLGQALFDLGRYDEAVRSLSRAIDLGIRDFDTWNFRGLGYVELREFSAALRDFDKALGTNQHNHIAFNNRGLTFSRQGDQRAAIEEYNRAIVLKPDYALAYNNRGFSYQLFDKHTLAIADYCKALNIDPHHKLARQNLNILGGVTKCRKIPGGTGTE